MERIIRTYFSVDLHGGKAPGTRWVVSQAGLIAIQDAVWKAIVCASPGNHTAMIQPIATVQHRLFSFLVGNLKVHFICVSFDILFWPVYTFSSIFIDLFWLACIILSCIISKQDCKIVYSMTKYSNFTREFFTFKVSYGFTVQA